MLVFYVLLYLQVRGYSATESGLRLVASSLGVSFTSCIRLASCVVRENSGAMSSEEMRTRHRVLHDQVGVKGAGRLGLQELFSVSTLITSSRTLHPVYGT